MKELSGRSRRTIQQAMGLLATMLQPEVAVLLDRLQAALARADGAAADRDCCMESLSALRKRRADFFPAMVELLEGGAAQAMLGARLPQRSAEAAMTAAPTALRLLDDDDIDEAGTLAAIATRHEHRASLALLLLGQRFGVLLGSPPRLGAALPVGPQALGAALAGAARRIGLCADARMTLYRLYDMEFMTRFPGFIEAMDAAIDRAGVLPGLAFVPLRPLAVPAAVAQGEDQAAQGDVPAAEARAARIINETVTSLREDGLMPESVATERNLAVAAMARYLLRHGSDSVEWQQCVHHARAVIGAVQRGDPPSQESRNWIDNALRSIGYADEEARRIALALTSVRGVPVEMARRVEGIRSAREQRTSERLAALSVGTRIGVSTGRGGFTRYRLRYHYPDPGLLLLANEADGQETLFEIDAVARQMVAGHAWVIRSAPGKDGADAPAPSGAAGQAWPTHASGRSLS